MGMPLSYFHKEIVTLYARIYRDLLPGGWCPVYSVSPVRWTGGFARIICFKFVFYALVNPFICLFSVAQAATAQRLIEDWAVTKQSRRSKRLTKSSNAVFLRVYPLFGITRYVGLAWPIRRIRASELEWFGLQNKNNRSVPPWGLTDRETQLCDDGEPKYSIHTLT